MTTTALISGQSIGTGSNMGTGILPIKLTLQTTTTAFVICGRMTNGAAAYNQREELRIWYTTSSFSITAAQAILQLNKTARYVDLRKSSLNAGVVIQDSSLEPVTGASLYIWCDVPNSTVAQTLDVNAVELP